MTIAAATVAREREQLAEAYAVQVVPDETPVGLTGDEGTGKRLAVIIINHGSFTITRIKSQFSPDVNVSLLSHFKYRRVSGLAGIPIALRNAAMEPEERAMYAVLTPWDTGIRFESDTVHDGFVKGPYPLVRWTDRWEDAMGAPARPGPPVRDDEPWSS